MGTKIPKIPLEQLKSMMDKGHTFVLMDILSAEAYAEKHLPGAVNVCVYEVDFLEKAKKAVADPLLSVVVYGGCKNSKAAVLACERLIAAGYDDVLLFSEGLEGWEKAGFPIEKPETEIGKRPSGSHRYNIDTLDSKLGWSGRSVLSRHFGTVAIKSGEIATQSGRIVGGSVAVDMLSMRCADLENAKLNETLIRHLGSEDFFDIREYPEAVLTIKSTDYGKSVSGESANRCKLETELALKGKTEPLNLIAMAGIRSDGALCLHAHFDLDRTKWGVLYGSERIFEGLGIHLVDDLVSFEAEIVAK